MAETASSGHSADDVGGAPKRLRHLMRPERGKYTLRDGRGRLSRTSRRRAAPTDAKPRPCARAIQQHRVGDGLDNAGHTPIAIGAPIPTVSQVKDGKLRALAVMGKTRLPALPDVPTIAEAGYPGLEAENWFAILVPAGTPQEIVMLLNRESARIIAMPDAKERLTALGMEPVISTPEDCSALIRAEIERWAKVVREAGIRAQ